MKKLLSVSLIALTGAKCVAMNGPSIGVALTDEQAATIVGGKLSRNCKRKLPGIGPSASLHEMSMESFRRVWSGVVLVPETQGWKKFILFLVGVGLGGLSWLVYRRVSSAS